MKEPVCVFCGGDGKAFRPEDRESGKKCSACGGTGIQKPIAIEADPCPPKIECCKAMGLNREGGPSHAA